MTYVIHARVQRTFTLALVVLLLATAGPARAWGKLGHRVVARFAEKHLNEKARQAVQELLDRDEDMADASTVPDDLYRRTIKGSGDWHFANVPIEEGQYRKEFCGSGSCVVEKLPEFIATVKDRSNSPQARQQALRFVIHLVGDIHQPLHVADHNDRGGNDLQVRFFRKGANLHKVWDVYILDQVSSDEDHWLEILDAMDTEENRAACSKIDVEKWANESLAAAKRAYKFPGTDRLLRRGDTIGSDYQDVNLPIARLRLYRAGLRLALVLNETLGK